MLKEKTMKKFLQELNKDYTLLSEVKGIREPILIKCNKCENTLESKPRYFLEKEYISVKTRTGRCKKCSLDLRSKKHEFLEYVKQQENYLLLNEYIDYRHKIIIKHLTCGQTYEVYPDKFKNKEQRCPYCFRDRKRKSKEFKQFLEKEGYSLLSDYENNKKPVKIKHNKCGDVFFVSPVHFTFSNRRCSQCNGNAFKGETKVYNYLKNITNNIQREHSFNGCRHKGLLRFDFYLPEYNICIEYNGKQHYEPVRFFGGEEEFKKRQIRDNIKKDYCYNNDIVLIEIPYWENNIEEFLNKKLNQLGITNSLNSNEN